MVLSVIAPKPKPNLFTNDYEVHMGVSKLGVPRNGWSIRENPIKMDDFGGTPISGTPHMLLHEFMMFEEIILMTQLF